MSYILGLDTGGTFTDAAILDEKNNKVLAKAKAPTTRHDLAIGLTEAIKSVLGGLPKAKHKRIKRVCLSTTLATNAVVEGAGGRVGLVLIGFDDKVLARNNLGAMQEDNPFVFIKGGHSADGKAQASLDMKALDSFAKAHSKDISAIAIAGHFATRNPEHECIARDHLRKLTDLPTTCSHELSSALGGPKRAVTTLLNARLISVLDEQIIKLESIIAKLGLAAELMVVRGDGTLVGTDFARMRPVETVLSGPAASLSGAAHLIGRCNGVVVDIGGTTTDIAVLEDGFPRLSAEGARIGGWATMVEAADVRTQGLGGDSEVHPATRGLASGVSLGPRRVIPLGALASDEPKVLQWLESSMIDPIPSGLDGRFVVPLFKGDLLPSWLTRSEARMAMACLEEGVVPIADVAATRLALRAIDRLVARGLLGLSAFTPTDAALVLGRFSDSSMNIEASRLGASLLARQRNGAGHPQAEDAEALSRMVLKQLTNQSAMAVLDASYAHSDMSKASSSPLIEQAVEEASKKAHDKLLGSKSKKDNNLVRMNIKLEYPLIALGASAGCHYPLVAEAIGAKLLIPDDADVAGAIGAAAGSIRQRATLTITQPSDGVFRVHGSDEVRDFKVMEEAISYAEDFAKQEAERRALAAGADKVSLETDRQVKIVSLGGDKELFIEASIHAIATSSS